MLLDEKRTKRMVQVVAILTSVAFAGVIFVIVGMMLLGGGTSDEQAQVNELKELVKNEPSSADAWQQLSSAYVAAKDYEQAIDAARTAVKLDPKNVRSTSALALALQESGDTDGAIDAWQAFTKANPGNAEGYLQLGSTAQQAGRTLVARLSYQKYLQLAPDSAQAEFVRQQLTSMSGAPTATTTTDGS